MMSLSKQKGYTATAMIIMLAIGGILTAGASRYAIRTSTENAGNALGQGLAQVNRALATYTINNYKPLVDGTLSLTPTIAVLQAAGLLNATFNPVPPIGGGYAAEITREPAGCVAPNCNLTARVWYTQSIVDPNTGNIDLAKLGAAAAAIGGDAGWSDAGAVSTIKGLSGWTRANPLGAKAGVLMAISGYGSSAFSQYVDRAGQQGMLADFHMGGNNIQAAATVNANSVVLPMGEGVRIGASSLFTDRSTLSLRAPGQVNIQTVDGSAGALAAGNITGYGVLRSTDTLCVTRTDSTCTGEGAAGVVATSTGNLAASGNVGAAGNVVAGQLISNGETTTNGFFRTNGDGGWYSQKWDGGLYMSDGAWVRSYADKNMYTGGQMQAGSLQANSNLRVLGTSQVDGNQTVGSQTVFGQQIVGGSQVVYGSVNASAAVTPGQIASEGGYCGGNAGAIARDANNNIFVCN